MRFRSVILLFYIINPWNSFAEEIAYAELWAKGTLSEKKIFVSGISIGLNLSTKYSLQNILQSEDSLATSVDSICEVSLQEKLKKNYRELHFGERGYGELTVVQMMDTLYKNEKNKNLNFQQTYMAALKEIEKRESGKLKNAKE